MSARGGVGDGAEEVESRTGANQTGAKEKRTHSRVKNEYRHPVTP